MPKKRSKNNERDNYMLRKRMHPGRSNNPDNPERKAPGKDGVHSNYRTKSKINILNRYRQKPDLEKMREEPHSKVRIQPDRKWFGNVRTISQKRVDEL